MTLHLEHDAPIEKVRACLRVQAVIVGGRLVRFVGRGQWLVVWADTELPYPGQGGA